MDNPVNDIDNLELAYSCKVPKKNDHPVFRDKKKMEEFLETHGMQYEVGKKNFKVRHLTKEQLDLLMENNLPIKEFAPEKKLIQRTTPVKAAGVSELLNPGHLLGGNAQEGNMDSEQQRTDDYYQPDIDLDL